LGVLKTGDKNLFIHRGGASTPIEMEPRCVLDFYVHETAQRRGIGALLFAFFLRDENKHPARLAYDRPSEKFLAFLAKHHGLVKYQNQTNNFVVFDAYFAVKPRPASAAREARKLAEGRGVGLAAAARAKAAAARAAREEASTRDAKRREDTTRLLALSSSSSRASSSELRDEERRGFARRVPSSSGASDGPYRESGIASSFSSRYKRPGRRFAERRDAGTAGSARTNENEKKRFARRLETVEPARVQDVLFPR
jgi:GNAT superfamily N-acetyltransferase